MQHERAEDYSILDLLAFYNYSQRTAKEKGLPYPPPAVTVYELAAMEQSEFERRRGVPETQEKK